MARVVTKTGLKSNLPTSDMLKGELHATTDRGTLHMPLDPTTKITITPAVDDLSIMPAVDGAADLLLIHDADGTGQKEKKITVNALKTALNIPESSTDEKVAVVSGGTSGYIFGTDGTDGVVRHDGSIAITKDASNGFVTLAVDVVDGGTF